MAVSAWLVEVRLCAASLDGHGAFRLGLVRFDWLRSGKAVGVRRGKSGCGPVWDGKVRQVGLGE